MSNSSELPWSDHPNAPKISRRLYRLEKASFGAIPLSLVFHGIIIVMFFRCMSALLHPSKLKQRCVKWPLVAHTVAMFSFATVSTMTGLYNGVISFLDARKFPGSSGFPPGPVGYIRLINYRAIGVVGNTPLLLNGWLADGLLLYRCHIIYGMSYRVIVFPCLMYLASIGVGIVYLFQESHPSYWTANFVDFGIIYISVSLSLNVLLTLMIIARLVLHNKVLRSGLGGRSTPTGVHKFLNTILIESCALYAVSSLFLIGSWRVESYLMDYLNNVLEAAQVIGPFLIILRVADRSALTSDVASGNLSSIRFGTQEESTEDDWSSVDRNPTGEADGRVETLGEVGVEAANPIKTTSL